MRRRLLDLLTLLSLLLFAVVAAAWLRSYFVGDRWAFPQGRVTGVTTAPWGDPDTWRVRHAVNSGGGRVQWVRVEHEGGADEPAGHSTMPPAEVILDLRRGARPPDRWHEALGIEYFVREKHYLPGRSGNHATYWGFRTVTLPYWCLASLPGALAAAGVASWVRRRTRRSRTVRGLCPACGYDIRATPGRCPECGTATTGPAA
ncbi:MAG TPA: hypothetical protein VFB66_25815 [Tepidisphaeraceae bacterium]|nr:hypothetical protein [Tepidisphaeraceae bacterium]